VVASDFVVHGIVARRHLERARAELALDALVRDHRHAPLDPGHDHFAADQVAIALVLGMDRDAGIAEHRLRPRRRHHDVGVRRAFDRIFEVPE